MNPPTRDKIIAQFRHELFGLVADAIVQERRGGELSMWLRMASAKVDARIGEIYDAIVPPAKQPEALPVKPAPQQPQQKAK